MFADQAAHGVLFATMLAVVGMVAYLVNRVSVLNQRLVGWKDGIAAGSIMPWSVVSLYNNTTGQTVHVTTSTAAPILVLAPGIDHTPGSAVRLVPVDQDGTAGRALRSGDHVYIQFVAWGLFYSATDPSRLTNDRASAAKVQINFAKADESGDLQRQFHRLMSREIVCDQRMMLLLGRLRAEERLAAFLLDLMERLRLRGFSTSSLVLRMTREEIGTYLGLKLETVSRCFSKLQDDGVLSVRQRQIRVLDAAALQKVVAGASC